MDDCSEALVKIKTAFRSGGVGVGGGAGAGIAGTGGARGDVDMPEEDLLDDEFQQQAGNGAARRRNNVITRQRGDAGLANFDELFNADFGGGFGDW